MSGKVRLLFAAAAAATCAGTAGAQSSVTLYGIVDAYVESLRISGLGSSQRVSNGGMQPSRWGVRGAEDLGAGLKAGFTLESGFDIGTGTLLQGGRSFGRQAFVSLSSASLGELRLGRQYAPIFQAFALTDIERVSAFSPVLAIATSNNDQVRQDNQVSYATPRFGGFSLLVSVSAGEGTAAAQPAGARVQRNLGAMGRYTGGGLDAFVAYHQGGQHATAGDIDQRSFMLGAGYEFGSVQLAGSYWEHRNKLPTGPSPKTRGAVLGAKLPLGAFSAMAQLARVEDDGRAYASGAAKADGRTHYLILGGNYALSKRTDVYLRYLRVEDRDGGFNGRATAALFGAFGPGTPLPVNGSAQTFALGVRHVF